jgi:hypothetical protein
MPARAGSGGSTRVGTCARRCRGASAAARTTWRAALPAWLHQRPRRRQHHPRRAHTARTSVHAGAKVEHVPVQLPQGGEHDGHKAPGLLLQHAPHSGFAGAVDRAHRHRVQQCGSDTCVCAAAQPGGEPRPFVFNRDVGAASNILRLGMSILCSGRGDRTALRRAGFRDTQLENDEAPCVP